MFIACHCGAVNENFCAVLLLRLRQAKFNISQFSSTRRVGQMTSRGNAGRRTIIFVTSPDLLGLKSADSNVPAILFISNTLFHDKSFIDANSNLLSMVSTSTRKILSSAFDIDCDLSDMDRRPAKR